MKKILLISFLVLLLSGCTAQYTMKINLDESVDEISNVFDYQNRYHTKITKEGMNNRLKDTFNTNYDVNVIANDIKFGFKSQASFDDLTSYKKNTKALNYLYNILNVYRNSNNVTIETEGKIDLSYIYNDMYDTVLLPEDCYIAIKLPFEVKNNNADRVDSDNNIYYWDIDKNSTDKSIKITYNSNVLYSNNPLYLFQYVPYIYKIIGITLISLIVLFIIGYSFYKRSIKNNRV